MDLSFTNVLSSLDTNVNNNLENSIDADEFIHRIKLTNMGGTSLKLLHLNIRSIRKNFDEFLIFLEAYKLRDLDIIILSETWEVTNINNFILPGYTIVSNGSNINQNDGQIIYINSNINYDITCIALNQTRVMLSRIILKKCNLTYNIMTCYRLPSTAADLFVTDLENFLHKPTNCSIDAFVGDINIDILNLESQISNKYLFMLMSLGFLSHINIPTRKTEKSNTCIDHIFTRRNNPKLNAIEKCVLNSNITDHYPIYMNIGYAKILVTKANQPLPQ